jgi:hypothetical protein
MDNEKRLRIIVLTGIIFIMNQAFLHKSLAAYEPPIRDENSFLWIETLVCDFVRWTLTSETDFEEILQQKLARLFAEVWKLQFSRPSALCSGASSLQRLAAIPLDLDYLLNLNQRIHQELSIFFLSRQHDPLTIRISQTEFVSQRRFLIDQMITLFHSQSNGFIAPARPIERPANDVLPPPN